MPKVSIFASNFNKEKYISLSIDSVLSQDFTDFEYLIVDDGSSDNSVLIIEEYCQKDSRIKFWNRGKKGLTNQYNFLLSKASQESEYITWLDTDDEYLPTSLSQRLYIFEQYPKVELVFNNLLHIGPEGKELDRSYPEKFENFFFGGYKQSINVAHIFHLLAYYNEIHPLSFGSLMFRKDFLSHLGISNPTQNVGYFMGDLDLFYQTVSSSPSYGMKDKILKYRVYPEQTLSTRIQEIHEDSGYMLHKLFEKGVISKADYLKIKSR